MYQNGISGSGISGNGISGNGSFLRLLPLKTKALCTSGRFSIVLESGNHSYGSLAAQTNQFFVRTVYVLRVFIFFEYHFRRTNFRYLAQQDLGKRRLSRG